MGSACQAGLDGPHKDVRGIANVATENGHHGAAADADEWREKEEDLPNGHSAPPGAQQLDEQKEQQTILWERFLPVKTLRVLLVENDDSTRQVVSALLRKCCYEGMPNK